MGNNLLKGKRGIVFGALNDMSIAWKVAERVVEEGAIITLSNTPLAVRMGTTDELATKLNAKLIPADATSVEDLQQVFEQSIEALGGKIDFVLHSIGMSPNVRKKRTYDDLDYDMLNTTIDISAISFHKMLQVAKKMNAINDYGSVVALSYMASQRTVFVITIWLMPNRCWNQSLVVLDIFTVANTVFVLIQFRNRLRQPRQVAA